MCKIRSIGGNEVRLFFRLTPTGFYYLLYSPAPPAGNTPGLFFIHLFRDGIFTFPHGKDGLFEQLIQFPAEPFGTVRDDIPVTACRKSFILEFLLEALDLHVLSAL